MTTPTLNSTLNLETPRDLERDASAFGGLFQQIMNEMKNSSPLWEDLTTKSTKLHACLRATIQAVSAFLDTFQKIADAATATKGATKDIGTSLTRICLRHKALEAKLKTFTSSILDCLIIPLQEKLEEWKKCTAQLDKEHAKDYKKARAELKKRSIDTIRLQKKVRKGFSNGNSLSNSFTGTGTLPRSGGHGGAMTASSTGSEVGLGNRELTRVLEQALRETVEKKQAFEDAEKQAIRTALIEERSRFCLFVSYLKPVVDDEVSMLSELTHVQEAMQQLEKQAGDPYALPPASEQVIQDLKGSCDSGTWSFQTPPSSPSSLGSRKSSMCSISSANSSSSGSAHSPSHNVHNRTVLHQPMMTLTYGPSHNHHQDPLRYSSVSSGDSGFVSQDVIYRHSAIPGYYNNENLRKPGGNQSEGSNTSSATSSNSSTPSSPYPQGSIPPTTTATWPNLQDSIQFERAACAIMNERPHTISSAYERGHPRPPLTVYTFQPPPLDGPNHPSLHQNPEGQNQHGSMYQTASEIYGILRGKRESKPPVPKRCSSLERPGVQDSNEQSNSVSNTVSSGPPPPRTTTKSGKGGKEDRKNSANLPPVPSLPDFNQASADMIVPQPVYVNMHELNQMASAKLLRQNSSTEKQHQSELPPPPPELMGHAIKNLDHHGQPHITKAESSSLASSGYGSSNPIMIGDDGTSYIYGYYSGPGSTGSGSNSNSSTLTGMTTMTTSSGTTIAACGDGTEDSCDLSVLESLCNCLELTISNGYFTLPRKLTHLRNCPYAKSTTFRPQSLSIRTTEDDFQFYGYLGRQGSRQSIATAGGDKPPPPIRRNSSISVGSSPARNSTPVSPVYNSIYGTAGPVPLQQHTVGNGFGQGFDSSGETTPHASMEQLPPPPSYLVTHAQLDPNDPAVKRMSVAETIKTLTEKNHQPVSPNMVRRSQSMKEDKPLPGNQSVSSGSSKTNRSPPSVPNNHKDRGTLIQLLSEKLSSPPQNPQVIYGTQMSMQPQHIYGHLSKSPPYPQTVTNVTPPGIQVSQSANNSPRPRRFSEELLKSTATFVQNRVLGTKTPPPVVTSKEIFVQTLNAKLSQMRVSSPPTDRRSSVPAISPASKTSFASKLVASVSSHGHGHHHHHQVTKAESGFRVRQWMSSSSSSKTIPDPLVVRESLMDQIRRGTKLKQTRGTGNDRSAPKFQH